ncbi:MAG: DUF4445 domain-containing protein [Gammaproteobacteria bacterium]|nr:DUF4445 domain-containing protein [Gammaproteobacteria bacterium]
MAAGKNSVTKEPTNNTLSFPHLDRQIEARPGETIYQAARRGSVRIVGACGGRGTCGSCMVHVSEGSFERTGEADGKRIKRWMRACQVSATSNCTVEISARSLAPVVRAETDVATDEQLPLAPVVVNHDLMLTAASLADVRADSERLLAAIPGATHCDLHALRALPAVLRSQQWQVRARVRHNEVIAVAAPGSRTLGLAIDLGTTNAAGFLIDLESGRRLASMGIENPQAAWGGDVISRINHAMVGGEPAAELQTAAVGALNALAHDLCLAVGALTDDIVDVAICGNTAMHHLLLGLPVRQLGKAPFIAAQRESVDIKARDIGLKVCAGAYVHLVGNIGGFVGGDHVTALLATEDQWQDGVPTLVMDIGTNTEITLIHGDRMYSASCPSGPALEGGHIACGMRAAEGAIEKVTIVNDSISLGIIGTRSQAAVGICGSGVLDVMAAMLSSGLMSARGRLAAGGVGISELKGKRILNLAPDVWFSQVDIRQVQLAKSAIRTGTELLMQAAGLVESDIQRFIIAGAFGAYINLESGIAIGLFPDLPRERFTQVGNAAGVGVRCLLASSHARRRADDIARTCEYVELSSVKAFQRRFVYHIDFHQPSTLTPGHV